MREYKGFFPSGYGKTKIQLNNDTYFGFWVFGAHLTHKITEQCPVVFSGEPSSDKEPEYKELIVFDGAADWNMPVPIEVKEVLPGTVCEDTGMTDMKGQKLFTNDIVQLEDPSLLPLKGQILWEEGKHMVRFQTSASGFISQHTVFNYKNRIKKIGNIFENPELLRSDSDEST